MIVIHIDFMEDTAGLKKVYDNLDGNVVLYNPTKEIVKKELLINDDDTILCLGHGTPQGLLGVGWKGWVLDEELVPLIRDRKIIGIWCHASLFADKHKLHGFFTSMFISNISEANAYGFWNNTNMDILKELDIFSEKINELIKNDVPMKDWVKILQEGCHKEKDYVSFNYESLTYFD